MKRWLPVVIAAALVAAVAVAQRPRGGLSSVSGQAITPVSVTSPGVGDFAGGLKADSLQTHSGGATEMDIATTGTGRVKLGNTAGSGQWDLNGLIASYNGLVSINSSLTYGAASTCIGTGAGGASAATIGANGTNCGFTVGGTGSGANAFGTAGTGTTTIGNSTGNVTSAGLWASSATSGNQFSCSGAATCNLHSASAQNVDIDCGGGTCNAQLGVTTATTTAVGRSGQTTQLNGNITFGSTLPALASSGNITTNSTSTPTLGCTGAATCTFNSATSQTATFDCGGGTCTAQLGASAATTTTIGRSAQTTNINGNATFGTAGPNLGSTVTGFVSAYASGLLVAATAYGAFQFTQSVNNLKIRNVSCSHAVAGTGTAATLAIRNVTDSTTLCSGSYTCTTTANVPTSIFDCNQTPLTGKLYAFDFTTGCGATQVSGLNCSAELAH